MVLVFFFFNDTATTEIYTLSLHDALPISPRRQGPSRRAPAGGSPRALRALVRDRKSTRLNSSHSQISYAVFCLIKNTCVTTQPRPVLAHLAVRRHGRPASRSPAARRVHCC